MRSLRSRFELACRIGVFGLIGWLLGTSLIPSAGRRVERATGTTLESRLAAWTRLAPSVALHADLSATPPTWAIDWLGALKRSGHVVTWNGSPPAVAVTAEALADPRGGARIDVAAPAGTRLSLRDDASMIDSVHVSSLGGSVTSPIVVGGVVATTGEETATAAAPESARVRSIVVVGGAGWEGKFIVAALEERGWPVVARFSVAPNVDVGQGGALVLDTAHVAAVVAVDTMVQELSGALERYVRSGGGLILAGASSQASSAAPLAPGALGARFRPTVLPKDTLSLGSTGFYPVSALKQDAVTLERRPAGIAIAARRVGAGRVVQVGYDDSWRWRMAGAPGSENAHREWWSRLISAVAYAPSAPAADSRVEESAPLARLVDAVGPARPVAAGVTDRAPVDRRILITLMLILLLAEWASRRLRGLR